MAVAAFETTAGGRDRTTGPLLALYGRLESRSLVLKVIFALPSLTPKVMIWRLRRVGIVPINIFISSPSFLSPFKRLLICLSCFSLMACFTEGVGTRWHRVFPLSYARTAR